MLPQIRAEVDAAGDPPSFARLAHGQALVSWAFAVAFLAGGVLAATLGPRPLFVVLGAGALGGRVGVD